MSREELVNAYVEGGISRRMFIRRLVPAGTSVGAAVSYAHLLAPQARAAAGTDGDGRDHYEPEIRVAIRTGRIARVIESRKLDISVSVDDPVVFTFKAQIRHKGRLKTIGVKQIGVNQAVTNRLVRIPIEEFGRRILSRRDGSWVRVVGVATHEQLELARAYTSRAVATKVLVS